MLAVVLARRIPITKDEAQGDAVTECVKVLQLGSKIPDLTLRYKTEVKLRQQESQLSLNFRPTFFGRNLQSD